MMRGVCVSGVAAAGWWWSGVRVLLVFSNRLQTGWSEVPCQPTCSNSGHGFLFAGVFSVYGCGSGHQQVAAAGVMSQG
jgi:hypothetical protein